MRGDLLRAPFAIIPLSINFNSTNKKLNKSGIMSSVVFYERSVVKKACLTFCAKGALINHGDRGARGVPGRRAAEPRDSGLGPAGTSPQEAPVRWVFRSLKGFVCAV